MTHFLRLVALFAVMALAPAATAQQFPVTIKHAFGETVIDAAPKRVVTWGWSSQDAAIALGTVPVGMPTFRSEGYDADILPWTADAIAALGAPAPVILNDSNELPIEQIAALKPDLILAVYSAISEPEYQLLSQIAPVVPFPEKPWTASWQEVITITGQALGKADEAQTLVASLEQLIVDEAAKHPELAGASVASFIDYDGLTAVHSADDPRAKLLLAAGMVYAEKPAAAGPSEAFWYPLSYENFDQLSADIIIGFFNTPEAADEFFGRSYIAAAEQVKRGSIVKMDDRILNLSVISASALSLPWGLPRYFDKIAEAARKAGR